MMIDCSKCRYFYGYDGVGELWTGCSIHGDFKGKKTHCNHFEKKVTKSDLLNKIQSLENEHERQNNEIKLLRKKIMEFQEEHAKDDWREYLLENSMDGTEVVEALNRQDRVIDAQAEINEKREKEYQELYNECQRHKRLRFKNAREIEARVNAFNRIVDSLKGQVPDWIIKELETAQILECDYEED